MANNVPYFVFLAGFLGLLGIDQFLKYSSLRMSTQKYVACNSGVAFGIPLPQSLLWGVAGVLLLGLGMWLWRECKRRAFRIVWGIALVMAGATSNLWDRGIYGCVVDYWQPFLFFPVFNLGDVGIFMGLSFLLFWQWRQETA
jgi:lipoprotein signal peptidase